MSESQWRTYQHRYDDSVIYEARRAGEEYEVRHPGTQASWTVDAEMFEDTYEETYEESV